MVYLVEEYNKWMSENITLTNAYSSESLKSLTVHMLMGKNYRLITENNTKSKLALTYLWLSDVVDKAKVEFGAEWKMKLLQDLLNTKQRNKEQKDLLFWLVGLTSKTSTNLGLLTKDLPEFMENLIKYMEKLLNNINRSDDIDKAWLLMMAGTATLNIRGSDKSKIGKVLEGVIIRSMLTILGLKENENFWMNIDRDAEVDRETDCEIETQRGRIRVEVGLISSGNQEVIEDKINRVGRNGVVLFDKVGARTRIYETAERHGVKLIQIRNNQPLVEIYRHLETLVKVKLIEPPTLEDDIIKSVNRLPNEIFMYRGNV